MQQELMNQYSIMIALTMSPSWVLKALTALFLDTPACVITNSVSRAFTSVSSTCSSSYKHRRWHIQSANPLYAALQFQKLIIIIVKYYNLHEVTQTVKGKVVFDCKLFHVMQLIKFSTGIKENLQITQTRYFSFYLTKQIKKLN